MNAVEVVRARIHLALQQDGGTPEIMTAEFAYDRSDPYAVTMTFTDNGAGIEVEWIFARSLLRNALKEVSGDGDLRAWVSPSGTAMVMRMTPPCGEAEIHVSLSALNAFLDRTYEIVVDGEEGLRIDLDALEAAIRRPNKR